MSAAILYKIQKENDLLKIAEFIIAHDNNNKLNEVMLLLNNIDYDLLAHLYNDVLTNEKGQ